MKPARALLFALALAASMTAAAQYQWIDKDGRRVFSDRPPPADVPAKNVLKHPRGNNASLVHQAPAQAAPAEAAASAPAAAASSAAPGVDKALEEKKRQAEAAEAAKQKAAEEKQAAARAENCKRATSAMAGLDSGMRISRTNEKGEREVLDDAQRAAERQRLQQIMAQDCK
ncbi:MAG: DUF4124 domain-containing protein [Pseudomonadota bacterium]|nr:DUF4124 domain-containing protein [Pseudomonadota bacterium]